MIPAPISQAFTEQSKSCAALGSPFMGRLMALCAAMPWPEGPVTDRISAWTGDISPRGQSVPLRLAGALHALVLQGNPDLRAVYPPHVPQDKALWTAVTTAMTDNASFIDAWLDSPPQTNEVRRAAILIAVGHWLHGRFKLPLRMSELGASGGLNLHWDAFALQINDQSFGAQDPVLTLTPDWSGPPPPQPAPQIATRAGVDLNPLDPQDPTDALRLQAFLWPDQPDRLALTRAAISTVLTPVDKADAIDWLAARLDHAAGQLHLIYSTVAWQYFPPEKQRRGTDLIVAAGAQATNASPLAWFGMENDGGTRGAALTLRLWPGDIKISLGRADFHGRWVDWTAP